MRLVTRDVAKFGMLVGFAAIFVDAAIAHGLFWDNDPYWTYWITKTFLIMTVFTFGTALLGIGIVQGLVLTAVHTLVLEVYYQWLAPVGLPQEPEWLDFNHLWVTGVPAHYLAILGGYLAALWIWRRAVAGAAVRPTATLEQDAQSMAWLALAGAAVVVLIDCALTQLLLLQSFPGLTFFVQRLLISFVFLFAWTAFVGSDVAAWLTGAVMMSLAWTTYSLYLGPRGLPTHPPSYLGYGDLWAKSFPGGVIAALIGLWLTSRFIRPHILRPARVAVSAVLFSLVAPGMLTGQGLPASASASGAGVMVVGPNPVDMGRTQPLQGSISISVIETGNRWSHVQNTDSVHVVAEFTAGGSSYGITIDKSMPRHPLGRYTTWSGVVYRHDMHGGTGIGTASLPKMRPEIALFGWAQVTRDGRIIAKMAPAHVMVTRRGQGAGIMLEVNTEDKALLGVPDGYITAAWHDIGEIAMPDTALRARSWIGWTALLALVVGFWVLATRERRA